VRKSAISGRRSIGQEACTAMCQESSKQAARLANNKVSMQASFDLTIRRWSRRIQAQIPC